MSNLQKGYVGYEEQVEKIVKNVVPDIKSLITNSSSKSVGPLKDVTLEKVVRDMANVFQDLRNGISLVKTTSKSDSLDDIEVKINKIYKKQDEINKQKEEARKKKAEEERKKTEKAKQRGKQSGSNKNKINSKTSNITNNSITSSKQSQRTTSIKKQDNNNNNNAITKRTSNSDKYAVTNLKFPKENNTQSKSVKGSSITDTISRLSRTKTGPDTPSLRRTPIVSQNKRASSVGPAREVYNPLGILKDEVERAIRDKKTFTIKGQFPAVRRSLLKRGWIEKYHPNYRMSEDIRHFKNMDVTGLVDLLRNRDVTESVKKIIKSKLLKDNQVDLYWDHTYDAFKECPDNVKLTLINRFRRESFSYTSKQGLCQAAREAHWLQIPGVACINHPRCFVLTKGGDTGFFLKDFGLTAAVSLLKWVVKNNITGECKIISDTGKIPMKAFDFAVAECYKFLKQQTHQDIDEDIREAMEVEWNEFLDQFYKIVHVGNHFKLADKNLNCFEEKDMVRKCNYLLNQLKEYMPSLDMDGYMNIWILKPTNSSRGIGIHICRTLQYILDVVRKNPNRRYVIQKYIERPFLIHDIKFDIRQWFLISSSYPLTIWLYKICYLRFSSQTYNLRKLHESIHLTNNSVQVKYMQSNSRDPLLPAYGMWDSKQFKNYLSDIGYPEIFDTVIYPGMKQCVTGAMIAHRDKIDRRKCCFELYGADFMLSENFEPWMLEINSNPALHASTPVTARLCPEVLEDVIKVVVDYDRNPNASTGNFELIYQEKLGDGAINFKQKLQVTGKPLPQNYFCDLEKDPTLLQVAPKPPASFEPPDPGKYLVQTRESMKDALKNLLDLVKKEKLKRFVILHSESPPKYFWDERSRREKSVEVNDLVVTDKPAELVSLFQNSTLSEGASEVALGGSSRDTLTEDETSNVLKVLQDMKELQNKRHVLTSLVKVVDQFKNVKK